MVCAARPAPTGGSSTRAIVTTALKKKGRSLPTSDVWIAAHAFESGAELLSFDLHFAHIDALAWRSLGG